MDIHYLDKLFNPSSIALIGATEKSYSIGAKVFNNLLQGGFSGPIYPVNPKYKALKAYSCFSSVLDVPSPIDLAVIVTPAKTIPQILIECGERNIHQAIILSSGFSENQFAGKQLEQKIIDIARRYRIKILGPNCIGLMRPVIGLNASFENESILKGNLAFVSQSGALCAAILDWAVEEKIGFSTILSLGNSADIDFGEVLDFLALDKKTDCILLYIEGIRHARRFMSGLRASSCIKPVIAIKAGRNTQGRRAAISQTGAMIGSDDVFDAALSRAGVVRVNSIKELFLAAEVFSCNRRSKGQNLMVITNGGGAGVIAADHAAHLNLPLAKLSPETVAQLRTILPFHWSHDNPVDILGDATPERFAKVIETCIKDENCDGLLVILVPIALSEPYKVAELLVELNKKTKKPILACWMGREQVKSSWSLFTTHKIPSFSTPETAVEAFSYLVNYYQNQQLLLQVPDPLTFKSQPDVLAAKFIIDSIAQEQRTNLTTVESKAILTAFGIPITQTLTAHNATEAIIAAESIGFPVVMKINSPDIPHKQDVDGVHLNISNPAAVVHFYNQLTKQALAKKPDAKILGVTIERMYKTAHDRELRIEVIQDPVFGPTISFGAGGHLVEIMQDRSITLPPLNQYLIHNLINRTRVAKLLGTFRNKPAVNLKAIEDLLLRVSEMVCELPNIRELDINPLIVNDEEIIAVDARIIIHFEKMSSAYCHLAIHPYPSQLVSHWQLTDQTPVIIRPIRPEDAKLEQEFVRRLSGKSKQFRFMGLLQELTPEMLKRTTQIDYDREMAMVAILQEDSKDAILGIARYVTNPDFQTCEFALVVADQWQNKGIGRHLMTCLMQAAKERNLRAMEGVIMSANTEMLTLVTNLGFTLRPDESDLTLQIATKLFV
jgi:acetyltransferase